MPAPWARGSRVRIIGQIHGQETVNVLHFATNTVINDGGPLDAALLLLAEAVVDCIVGSLLQCISSDWRLVQVEAQNISPTLTDPVVSTPSTAAVGEGATTNVSFASTLVQVRTGGGGRKGRGRIFLAPVDDASQVQSTLTADAETCLDTFLNCLKGKFMGPGATTDWHFGVLSRKTLTAVGGTFDNAFREATQLTPAHDVAIMSSRKVGKGS